MSFTKETARRAVRTFFQAVIAYLLVALKQGVDFTSGEAVKTLVLGLIAAGLAALMNLNGERGAGTKMSLADFTARYLGKGTDYDGVSGVQCVDLAKLYIDKVLGVKPQSIGNAHCYYDRFETTYLAGHFYKIPYKKGVKAQKGDLVVWGRYYNGKSPYGHIAIATGVQDESSITTYDQNWGGAPMKKVRHSLVGLSGFLRPMEQTPPAYFKKCGARFVSLVDALESIGEKSAYAYRKKIAAANGVKAYLGTAKQNTRLLSLLKKGRLLRP